MRSRMPKVWHSVGGLPLLEHSLRAAEAATSGRPIVVVSKLEDSVSARLEQRAELVSQSSTPGDGRRLGGGERGTGR